MRILQVVPFFPPDRGFGEREAVNQLSRALTKRGHEVVIYTSDARDLTSRMAIRPVINTNGMEIHYFRNFPTKQIKGLYVTPGLISKARKDAKEFDVIHLHGYWSFQNIVLHHYARKCLVPYLLQAHGSLPVGSSHKNLKLLFDFFFGTRIIEDASRVVAVSQMEVYQYLAKGIPMHKIVKIPNGMDFEQLTASRGRFRKKFSIDDNKKIILYVGRLHPMKGVDLLIEAYARLVREFDDILLVIVGPDDGCFYSLQAQVILLGLTERIIFTGPLYGQDKFDVYADSDIFVLPSRYEIFGLVLLEASAFSLPIVASNLQSISEIIQDEQIGRLFTAGSVQSLVDEITKTLQHPEEARIMAENSLSSAKDRFGINRVAESLESVYLELINPRSCLIGHCDQEPV